MLYYEQKMREQKEPQKMSKSNNYFLEIRGLGYVSAIRGSKLHLTRDFSQALRLSLEDWEKIENKGWLDDVPVYSFCNYALPF